MKSSKDVQEVLFYNQKNSKLNYVSSSALTNSNSNVILNKSNFQEQTGIELKLGFEAKLSMEDRKKEIMYNVMNDNRLYTPSSYQ